MKLRKQHSPCGKGVNIRCPYIAAVDPKIGISQIVRDNQKNFRAVIGSLLAKESFEELLNLRRIEVKKSPTKKNRLYRYCEKQNRAR